MITLDDVAAEAGVHPSTVSRTLSRPDMVNPATLVKVSAAAERLGYVPNRAARQLAGGGTATIAVLVPDVTNPFFSGVVRATQQCATATDRLVLLVDTGGRPRTETDAIASLRPNVDGIVVGSPSAPTGALVNAAAGTPLVFVNRRARSVPSIIVDQGEIIDLAVGHLRSLGHTDIGVLIGPSSYWSSSERSRRLDAMEHANGDATSIVRIDSFEPTFDGGKASLGTVLDAGLTAIATFNDVMALGLIAAASEHGVDVPDDLSIVGSDGVPLSAMSTPALTTVAAPVQELGAGAIEILDHTMEAPMSKRLTQRTTRPHLEVRSSTSSPRAPTR